MAASLSSFSPIISSSSPISGSTITPPSKRQRPSSSSSSSLSGDVDRYATGIFRGGEPPFSPSISSRDVELAVGLYVRTLVEGTEKHPELVIENDRHEPGWAPLLLLARKEIREKTVAFAKELKMSSDGLQKNPKRNWAKALIALYDLVYKGLPFAGSEARLLELLRGALKTLRASSRGSRASMVRCQAKIGALNKKRDTVPPGYKRKIDASLDALKGFYKQRREMMGPLGSCADKVAEVMNAIRHHEGDTSSLIQSLEKVLTTYADVKKMEERFPYPHSSQI